MYKISIIIPVFNAEKYIKRCFDNLLSQTIGFSNIQVIFVDDGSTDNSSQLIDKYAEDYDNVISIHFHENSGTAGKPRNEGMKFTFSDYILFFDPDDILMENACEVLYTKMIESDVDIVSGGYKKQNWIATWKPFIDADETFITNPKENFSIYFNPPGLPAKLFKRDLLIKNDIKFPEIRMAEDIVFLIKSYFYANSILSLNNFIVFEYYVRTDINNKSVTQNITKKYLYDLLEGYVGVLDLFEEFNINPLLRKIYFTKNHFNFLRVQLNELKINPEELSELFKSQLFLKIRNQKFVLEDDELNDFFNQFIKNHEDVTGKMLQSICRRTQKEFIESNTYITEEKYECKENNMKKDYEIQNIEKELYFFIKKNAKLYNSIEDSKK
ncbi:glycosyltransferase family 2 protein [Methanobrevibacter millerae]|uniref:Glycosyltransferase involved in cell wall bisynthesis n=1 Tax=Methanobrevibacter millerae TaxID=230361 RepID=A0A1G5V948_9EURY|nr:glycosyltransferase family 2 protein [Methanobrevibacter millerae]SDA42334.1 Glycosyltransferase involved in cell wall bisynthesis [Methanobrevibacter millerae]